MNATIEGVFAADGPLARALPDFEARPGQVQMAQFIEHGILEKMHTLVEAGTGVGKSLAYLIPAIRSGKKVVLSTGTIALQEQLVNKDIPLVREALHADLRVALLKGRNQYLCKQKLERMRGERLVASSAGMEKLWAWADRTTAGDRGELDFVPSGDEWEQLDADADDCVGEFCSHFRDCFYFRKRDDARYADVVVVNHALFFLDLVVGGGLIPAYDVAVLDEAHQCERWATDALTASLSRASLGRMMRKLHRHYAVPAGLSAGIDEGVRHLEASLAGGRGDRYPLRENDEAWPALESVRDALYRLENWLVDHWETDLKKHPDNAAEAERRRDLAMRPILANEAAIDRMHLPPDESVSWVERGDGDGRYSVNCAPYDVAEFLRAQLFARTQSVVLTSATIAPFAFIKRSLGLDEAQEFVAPSPFDFARQARLYIAQPRLNPKSPDFARLAAPIVEECLDRSQGRAFVLFTSYARLREVHALLRGRIAFPLKLQGELPRAQLVQWFRQTRNAVLFATGTFWEGIDVIGEALSCVIIDRLPFPSPADPIVTARVRALEARGLDGFEHYMVPAATVRLKQGFGRLIRSGRDRGVVVLLDGRAAATRWGATILAALPPATRIHHLDELNGFFSQ